MANLGLDLSGYEARSGNDPIPPGKYLAEITDSEVKLTSTKQEPMLKVEFTVTEGDYIDRKVWENFVLSNKIALGRLKALAIAARHPNPDMIQDSEEFHGLSCEIKVKLEIDKSGKYDPQNRITSYKQVAGSAAPVIPTAPAIPQVVAPAPIPQQPAAPTMQAPVAPAAPANTSGLPWA